MNKTLKQQFKEAIAHYEVHADYEKRRGLQATDGSNIQNELLMAAKFNEGRAKGFKEALEILEQIIG